MLTTRENTRPMANISLLVPFMTPIEVVRPITCTHTLKCYDGWGEV
jgi:hypothetical protein